MQTGVTHLTRIGRRNQEHQHHSESGFVVDKLPQLVERPGIASVALVPASWVLVGALPNPGQIFQDQHGLLLACFGHERFTDDVVGMPLKPFFTPRQPLQELTAAPPRAPRAFRGFLLEGCTYAAMAITHPRYVITSPGLARTGVGNVTPSQVDADRLIWERRGIDRQVELDMHGVGAISALTELGCLRRRTLQFAALVVAGSQRQSFPAMQQGQAHGHIPFTKAKDTGVVLNTGRAKLLHRTAGLMRGFAIHCHTPNSLDGEVGRQLEAIPHVVVDQRLHAVFVANVGRQGRMDIGARFRKAHQRCIKLFRLLISWLEFANQCQYLFHGENYITMMISAQWRKGYDLKA